jgi:hypothetical protein
MSDEPEGTKANGRVTIRSVPFSTMSLGRRASRLQTLSYAAFSA